MNNLFSYATKELSQDAMFCWLVNWLNDDPESQLYQLGAAIMDLFLGEKRFLEYRNVEVVRQFNKIDVLILFNNSYALILEDKTNTSEHGNQIKRYKEVLEKEGKAKFKNREVLTAYVKTGIMYDADCMTQADSVVTLQDLLRVLTPFAKKGISEILSDYVAYLQNMADDRNNADREIDCGNYSKAFETRYGQFSFLNRVFDTRSKATELGRVYANSNDSAAVFIDNIYAGTNNGGGPWTQYCFWGQQYIQSSSDMNEYHYLFWRIDCKWARKDKQDKHSEYEPIYYLALRHYDENAHSKNDFNNKRKREVYGVLREVAKKIEANDSHSIIQKIGKRANYKESDLIFIPVQNLQGIGSFEEVKAYLLQITTDMKDAANSMERY